MHEVKRIVVFTGNPGYSVRRGMIAIDKAIPGLSWLVMIHSPTRSLQETMRNQWRNLKRHGWRRIPDVARSLRDRLSSTSHNVYRSDDSIGFEYSMEHLRNLPNFHFIEFEDIHSEEAISTIRDFRPDLGLSLAAPILRNNIFDIPRLGTLNLHKGKVPEYRGMPPAFWEMWNDEDSVGCTVHWVDEKLDTGAIALTSSIARQPHSTVKGLQLQLDEIGIELMKDAVVQIDQGKRLYTPQEGEGRTYRQPTLKQAALLKRKLDARSPSSGSGAKRFLKDVFRKTIFVAGKSGLRRLATPRITVLLYHRVTDDVRDNLTTGIEQFDRHMKLLKKHFRVLPLSDLLNMDSIPRTDRPIVCVTFDDGYLDNYTNAFPILLRHNVHATFFVSTGLIGTERQFPHDIRRGNKPIPLMNWNHLKEMHDEGIAIGSHTISHIDCASEDADTVRNELVGSLQELRSRLGMEDVIFSYPYGGREHMTEERLEMVKEVGYSGCVSAYGGVNIGKIDRFNILRRGIHWEFSDASFLHAAQGLL